MTEKDCPKVSICCITYNHVNFIKDALDGFLMQKTNFPFEILVHDDASTDGTSDIVKEYAEKYPDLIHAIIQPENIWHKGKVGSNDYLYPLVRGQYVAINEGDDYWTDEYKLQKQVDFLDSHPDYTICFHPVEVKSFKKEEHPVYPYEEITKGKKSFTLLDEIQKNLIQTNSVMYRWIFNRTDFKAEEMIPRNVTPGDWFLHIMHAQKGKIYMLDDIMGVYRRHPGGMYSDDMNNIMEKYGISHLNFFIQLEKMVPDYLIYGGHAHTLNFAASLFQFYLDRQNFKDMQAIIEMCPDLLNPQ